MTPSDIRHHSTILSAGAVPRIAIVGAEADRWTRAGEVAARRIITHVLEATGGVVVSGGCPFGGVDQWVEEIAAAIGREVEIFHPHTLNWEQGFKPRNVQIARVSAFVHCVTPDALPGGYEKHPHVRPERIPALRECYHCRRFGWPAKHTTSGGCWTLHYARRLGKSVRLHVVPNR